MLFHLHIAFVALTGVLCVAVADPLTFCKDEDCGNCPVSITSVGTGYPDCAIYSSRDVFSNQSFPTQNGSIAAYLDVPYQPEPASCYLIFKSPADTTMPGCGKIQKHFHNAECGTVSLGETFIVQFCCGSADCAAAGIPNQPPLLHSAKFGSGTNADNIGLMGGSGGGVQSLRIAVNGTEIKPIYVGPPQVSTMNTSSELSRRHAACDGDWVPDAGFEDYTRPADGPEIMSDVAVAGLTLLISQTRTQEWSQTVESSLGFDDILSLGISFSKSFSKSVSDSESLSYLVPAGQAGYIAWTSYLRCSRGTGTCNHKKVSGEVCTPYVDPNSHRLAGEFSVVKSDDNGGG